jgi:AcrR family transcriptional regulator
VFCIFKREQQGNQGSDMAHSTDKTDEKLIDAFKQLMLKKPVDKIRVSEIIEFADVSRPTFYRHFKDKDDLICWYSEKVSAEAFKSSEHASEYKDILNIWMKALQCEKDFYIAAFQSQSQNNLAKYSYKMVLEAYCGHIEKKTGEAIDPDVLFALKFFLTGAIYMIMEWPKDDMRESYTVIAERIADVLPVKLHTFFHTFKPHTN